MSAAHRTELLLRWAPALVLLTLLAAFSAAHPDFLSRSNLGRIAIASTPALMVALGVGFVIIMGSIDLSMEGTLSTTAVLFAIAFNAWGGELLGGGLLAIPVALLAGAAIGLVNGLVHVKLRIPSFMASLAIGFVGMGLSVLLTGGAIVRVNDGVFRALLFQRICGFPLMVYAAIGLVLIAWFIQRNTTLGRNFYALGGGEEIAHSCGLDVRRVRVLGFALAGVFYALGAIFAVARGGMAESLTGSNYMFLGITSVAVGGTSLMGGNGGVWNTVAGVLIVNVIVNGMVVLGLPHFIQDGVLGVLIIAAVVLSTNRKSSALVK
ncbi:ABC transporter permease [Verminephrobacter aporrectodeae subsp. tuberculatae]|uniref:ABC transporter permease n=1 Tax=Verminephrobacter aporrectodeae TaxID=1110389 RepID=UPI00223856CC|nr:ABC transporter permease [Verminephrobacter aporrectodeae]MCW5222801.1 ABC transporter permease [Verminephrobacter aporrectodeae subsp. tuberculatae]MCW5256971.1 ABC transporter permease [Verminephrobacter aporrectodeae subsp. tuberculatae]MCW5288265.1 ABC transporter permease [Verminephrobacter aporrectodeae subsp. tuberculatae]MCW8206575.1 ABC transporter permease [Verminephrobacter aporrectodeae subsp. tuberculatae]